MATWTVTITDTNGTTYEPDVLGGSRRNRRANGRPTDEIVVPYRRQSDGTSLWNGSEFDGATVSVDYNGDPEPVDTLVDVDTESGRATLICRGGSELDNRIQKDFGVIETHLAAQDVAGETSYDQDIPTPSTTTDTGVTVQDKSSLSDADLQAPLDETDPLAFSSGDLVLQQSSSFNDHADETFDTAGQSFTAISGASFTYRMPADAVSVGLLVQSVSSATEIVAEVGGQEVGRIDAGTSYGSDQWVTLDARADVLEAGTSYDVTLRVPDDAAKVNDATTVEATLLYDNRYSYTFDASLSTTPESYPDAVQRAFAAPALTRAVNAGSVSTKANSVQALRIESGTGEAGGTSSTSPTSSFSYSFAERWASLRFIVELGRSGSQTLTGYTLTADLEDMPLVVEEEFEGSVADVLSDLTQTIRGDFVWAYRRNDAGNGEIGFVRSGERSILTSGKVSDFDVTRNIAAQLDQVTIKGGVQQVLGEVVKVSHGTAVQLDQANLLARSERVVDADGQTFERGADYTIDYGSGTITALSSGAIPDGARLAIDYRWRPRATVTRSGVSTPERTETETLAQLRADRACSLAAQQILRATDSPVYEATALLAGNLEFEVTQEVEPDAFPVNEALQIKTVEARAGRTDLRLASRDPLPDVINAVRDRLGGVEERVMTGAERKDGLGSGGGGTTVRTIEGSGGVTVEDDQTAVVDPASAISAGTGLTASDDGDGTATLDVAGGGGPTQFSSISRTASFSPSNFEVRNRSGVVRGGDYLYVAGYDTSSSDYALLVVDVSTPSSPSEAGRLVSGQLALARGLAVDGDYLYYTGSSQTGVVDISTPSTPTIASNVTRLGNTLVKTGDYVFVAANETVGLFDVSSPSAISSVKNIDVTDLRNPTHIGLDAATDLVYVAEGEGGDYHVLDVSSPTSHNYVGVTNQPPEEVVRDTAWSVAYDGSHAYWSDAVDNTIYVAAVTISSGVGTDVPGVPDAGPYWRLNTKAVEEFEATDAGAMIADRGRQATFRTGALNRSLAYDPDLDALFFVDGSGNLTRVGHTASGFSEQYSTSVVDANRSLVVGPTTLYMGRANSGDVELAAYDPADGTESWRVTVRSGLSSPFFPSLAAYSDGDVFVAAGGSSTDYNLYRYDDTGTQQDANTSVPSLSATLFPIAVADGGPLYADESGTWRTFAISDLSATGSTAGALGSNVERIAVTADGGLVAVGSGGSGLEKLASDLSQDWRVEHVDTQFSRALAATPDGAVYHAVGTDNASFDEATFEIVKRDSAGARLYETLDGPFEQYALAGYGGTQGAFSGHW